MLTRLKISWHSLAFSFWLITAVLLLLYLWTLTETVSLEIQVQDGQCTAFLGERSSEIACPDLAGGEVGVYLTSTSIVEKLQTRPLDFFAPGAAWGNITMEAEEGDNVAKVFEELSIVPGAVTTWPVLDSKVYTIQARIKRPDGEQADILLIPSGSDGGWIFQVDSENRQAVWRHWQNGQEADVISGVPYQKPFMAQLQSLLRLIIGTFFGALFIIFIVAIVQRAGRLAGQHVSSSASQRLNPSSRSLAVHTPNHAAILLFTFIILLSIFAVTLWIALDLLERIPHVQDSITYLFQAQTLARGALWAPEPPLPEAFAQEFLTVWDGKWFGQYPPGYPAVLAIGVLTGAPWLVNPLLAVLSTALLIKLGMLLYRRSTGLLAGGLALLSPFFIFLSGSLMIHAAELFWVALTMVAWTLALKSPYRTRWAILAGAALGMLFLTRQITAVITGFSFISLMFVFEILLPRNTSLQQRWREAIRPAAGLVLAALPFVILLLGYQAVLTGSPWQDPRLLSRPFDSPGFGPQIGESENAFKLQVKEGETIKVWYTDPQQPPRGHSPARGLYNTERNLESLTRELFGWHPLIALAFCWIPFLLGKSQKRDWVLLAMLLVVVAAYIAYWTTGIMYGPRYYFAALPALLLLTARGLQTLRDRFGTTAMVTVFTVMVGLTFFFYWPTAPSSLRGYNFISGEEKALVEEQVEKPALVFIPVIDWWDYGRFLSGNTPWLDGPIIYARDLGEENNKSLQKAFPERAAYLWQPDSNNVKP